MRDKYNLIYNISIFNLEKIWQSMKKKLLNEIFIIVL